MATAWLFPGQGSYAVGMGQAWAALSNGARDVFAQSADVLGFDLPRIIADGPAEVLAATDNQQPALLVTSIAILEAAAERRDLPEPDYVAGHSVGEYAALVAARALGFGDALRLVRARAELMRAAGDESPGGMAAVLGLEDALVEDVCRPITGVQVANYNAPGQVVVSGTKSGVGAAVAALESAGARRVIPVRITVAAHSQLMAPAAASLARLVDATSIQDAEVPVVANVTARPISTADEIRDELRRQLVSSVRWADSIRFMLDSGVRHFYEVGPGTVLSGLVKRIARGLPFAKEVVVVSLDAPPADGMAKPA